MATIQRQILIELKASNEQLKRKLQESQTATEKFKGSIAGIRTAWLGAAVGGAALFRVGSTLVNLYAEQEKAEKRLADALKTTGQFTEQSFQAMKAYASELQNATLFGDEAILTTQSLLVTLGAQPKHLREATALTLDWSAAMGKDLNAAALDVGKALAGNVAMLQRYGIQIDATTFATEGAEGVMRRLQERVGGRAAGERNTVFGSFQSLSNIMGDLGEVIGSKLAPKAAELAEDFNVMAQAAIILATATENQGSFLGALIQKFQEHKEQVLALVAPWELIRSRALDYITETSRELVLTNRAIEASRAGVEDTVGELEKWLNLQAGIGTASEAVAASWSELHGNVEAVASKGAEILGVAQHLVIPYGEVEARTKGILTTESIRLALNQELARTMAAEQLQAINQMSGSMDRIVQAAHAWGLETDTTLAKFLAIFRTALEVASIMGSIKAGQTSSGAGVLGILGTVAGFLPFLFGRTAGAGGVGVQTAAAPISITLAIDRRTFFESVIIPGAQQHMRAIGGSGVDLFVNKRHRVAITS